MPIIYQNKTAMPEKNNVPGLIVRSNKLHLNKCKLSEYNVWWDCLEFSDKMDLSYPNENI